MFKEGIFRAPRLKTNKILKKYAPLFSGRVINVSGSSDKDKDCSFFDYYFGNYDNGKRYKEYFVNASEYVVSNYSGDLTDYSIDKKEMISLDLEEQLPQELASKFDVVFCHTVLEHTFNIFQSFKNLAELSRDIVILVVPQFQMIHDYHRGYKDYWRFTPFSIDKLFKKNNMHVLYRETTHGFSESMYLFYIATKNKDKWESKFPPPIEIKVYLNKKNNGSSYTMISRNIIKLDRLIRKMVNKKNAKKVF